MLREGVATNHGRRFWWRIAGLIPLAFGIATLAGCTDDAPTSPTRETAVAASATASSIEDFIPDDLLPLVHAGETIASAYNGFKTAREVFETVLRITGIIATPPTMNQLLNALIADMNRSFAQLEWRITELDRQNRLGSANAATQMAAAELRQFGPGAVIDNTTLLQSRTTVEQAIMPIQFERKFVASATGPGPARNCESSSLDRLEWKTLFRCASVREPGGVPRDPPDLRNVDQNGQRWFVQYDWRLGVPALLQLIGLRLQVMAAADNSLAARRSPVFGPDIDEYLSELSKHYTRMANGVQCAFRLTTIDTQGSPFPQDWVLVNKLWVGCADLYTGANIVESFDLDRHPVSDLKVRELQDGYRNELFRRMGMEELLSVITTLHYLSQGPRVLVEDDTPGHYNDKLGTILDRPTGPFPSPDEDPDIFPAPDPTDQLPNEAREILGEWLTDPAALNGNWTDLQGIPGSWDEFAETAIIYRFDVGTVETRLIGDFAIDNGIFVWVNGNYKFGAIQPGAAVLGEYRVDLGTVPSGVNFIQILREDHGGETGYHVRITGRPLAPLP